MVGVAIMVPIPVILLAGIAAHTTAGRSSVPVAIVVTISPLLRVLIVTIGALSLVIGICALPLATRLIRIGWCLRITVRLVLTILVRLLTVGIIVFTILAR